MPFSISDYFTHLGHSKEPESVEIGFSRWSELPYYSMERKNYIHILHI